MHAGISNIAWHSWVRTPAQALLLASLLVWGVAQTASPPAVSHEEWERAVNRVRLLGENDVPRAYAEAQRMRAAMPRDAPPADRARILNVLARIENYLGLPDVAAYHASAALEIARKHGDRIGQIEAGLNISLTSVDRARMEELFAITRQTLTLAEKVDRPDLVAAVLLQAALAYRLVGRFEDSVATSVHAMQIARRSKAPYALLYAHQALALAFEQSDRFREANEHYRAMYEQAQRVGSKLLMADALGGIGSTQLRLGNAQDAEAVIRERIRIYREVGTPFGLFNANYHLANVLAQQGRHVERLAILDQLVANFDRYPIKIGMWYTLFARSAAYQQLGRLDDAMKDARWANELAKEIAFPLWESESARRLASIYDARHEYRTAYKYSVLAAELTSKAARERASLRIVELADRYQRESRQQELDELTRQNHEQALIIRQRDLEQRWLLTLAVASVLGIAIIAVFLFRLRLKHRQLEAVNADLQRSQRELREQSEAIRVLNASLETRVAERTAQLQVAVQELEAFNYSASHDLKAPLRTMSGFSSVLLETQADRMDPQTQRHLRHIAAAARRMGQIIDDLLTLSRANRAELHFEMVNLNVIAAEVAEELRRSAPERDVQFIIAPQLEAHCDPSLMRIVFENLLGNAFKFTSKCTHARIEVGWQNTNTCGAFFVRDNGVGFHCDDESRVFKPFERLHSATEFPGSGIGLATVERIIKRHGARIWAQARPGEGATFYFTLPAATSQTSAVA